MKIVWALPEATVRDVYEALLSKRSIAYTTVMTLMGILESKGHLEKTTTDRRHVYRAVRPREQSVSALVGDFLDRVFSGATKPLLVQLVEDGRLTASDVEELRRLIKAKK